MVVVTTISRHYDWLKLAHCKPRLEPAIKVEKKKSEHKLDLYIHRAIFNHDLVVAKLPELLGEPD
jgi:hypothetical protein